MIELRPFRGLRFDLDVVGSLGDVIAPPYDVIDDADRDRLYSAGMRNIVRIDSGKDYGDDIPDVHDRYTRARDHLESWKAMDILVREDRPALYVSSHQFLGKHGVHEERLGIYCAVRIDDEAPPLLLHERTASSPIGDRLNLLRSTNVMTSAIFGMWDPASAAIDTLIDDLHASPPAAEGTVDWHGSEEQHALWVLDDPVRIQQITEVLSTSTVLIADGHHRYAASQQYSRELHRMHPEWTSPAPGDWALVYLTAARGQALHLDATHRLIQLGPGLPEISTDILDDLSPACAWQEHHDEAACWRAIANFHSTGRSAWIISIAGRYFSVWTTPPPGDHRSSLPVSIVEDMVMHKFAHALGMSHTALLEHTHYIHDSSTIIAATRDHPVSTLGIILPPCTIDDVLSVSRAGGAMPRKSTYFTPKLPTGLVLLPLDE